MGPEKATQMAHLTEPAMASLMEDLMEFGMAQSKELETEWSMDYPRGLERVAPMGLQMA